MQIRAFSYSVEVMYIWYSFLVGVGKGYLSVFKLLQVRIEYRSKAGVRKDAFVETLPIRTGQSDKFFKAKDLCESCSFYLVDSN